MQPPRSSPATFDIARAVIPPRVIDDALRILHLDLLERGATADELGRWLWGCHWFPHLNDDPRIVALADALPESWRSGERCNTQILLQFPHTGPEPEITFHLDREPDWADGRRYLRIVGIALSAWSAANGGLLVRPDDQVVAVQLAAGDAVRMDPGLLHSSAINRTGGIRYAVYFRWLQAAAPRDGDQRPPAAASSASRMQRASSAAGSGSQT
ncbi:MAG: phytanoyl-CoA dioxygenase family protein [Solirubrobacterales bacterium]|nr:phytanoyl-CoA dioxygenase family protein [Solirubrobacterales bacterium]